MNSATEPQAWSWLQELELFARRIKNPAHLDYAARLYFDGTAYQRDARSSNVTHAMSALRVEMVRDLIQAFWQGNDDFIQRTASVLAGHQVRARGLEGESLLGTSGSICGIWRRFRQVTQRQPVVPLAPAQAFERHMAEIEARVAEEQRWIAQRREAFCSPWAEEQGRAIRETEERWAAMHGMDLAAIVRMRLFDEIDRAFLDYGKRPIEDLTQQVRDGIRPHFMALRGNAQKKHARRLRVVRSEQLADFLPDHLIAAVFESMREGTSGWCSAIRPLLQQAEMDWHKGDFARQRRAWLKLNQTADPPHKENHTREAIS
jgi:hypothetical protein